MSFPEVLAKLQAGWTGACRHLIGSASLLDEEQYDRLGELFDEAVAAFTTSDGEPIQADFLFPGQDVERAACWARGGMILYAVLTFGDNTRVRFLTLGVTRRGTVVAVS